MKDPFLVSAQTAVILDLVAKLDYSPAARSNAHFWLNTPNVLTAGVTPLIYIEEGYGDKLIKQLQEKV